MSTPQSLPSHREAPGLVDLRTDPRWSPLERSSVIGEWQCWSWEEAVLPGGSPYDTVLLHRLGGMLRVAAIDPVHNLQSPDPHADAWVATGVISQMLRTFEDPELALSGAARVLHDPGRRPRQRNPLATVAVCDLELASGRVRVTRCADAEVWVRVGTAGAVGTAGEAAPFRLAAPGEMLASEGLQVWDEVHSPELLADMPTHFALKERVLDDPALWLSPALGLEPFARPHVEEIEAVSEIIVSTDGARLTSERCEVIQDWVRGDLQRGVLTPAQVSPHGDLALAHLWR